ncbi:MAG: S46 family peptidase [Acidobacteriota bacterium]|nr:S46 family peptidase [Blastocatellia bacterium]MDW8412281.1 S46 family peptidase [Acidobacteriota bacterium]
MRTRLLFLIAALAIVSYVSTSVSSADEGMWTFDNPPLKQLKEKYNFEPTKEWLDHVRLSSVRLNDGGSGSFVSSDGLIMTNHHVASGQLAKLSTPERDLLKTGFYAKTQQEELRCPDLEVNVLVSLENVTERIQNATKGVDEKKAEELRSAEIAKIEKESTEQTGLRSNVITLYQGGEYWLYRFKKYTDIRLVFAPEQDIAFFGGDPDNFTYPRFNLDVTFLRAYEDGKPAKTEHYFRWSCNGPSEGELVFVSGNPGSTDRLQPFAQLVFEKEFSNPLSLQVLRRLREKLMEFSNRGAEQKRIAKDLLFSVENSLKAINGHQEGLSDPKVMAKKKADEDELRKKVSERADLQKLYGDAWSSLDVIYQKLPEVSKRAAYSRIRFSRLFSIATDIARYATELKKPNTERLPQYRDSNLESFKFRLLSPAPIYKDFEEFLLTHSLEESLEALGKDDEFVQTALGGRKPSEVAREAVANTKLMDVDYRKKLLEEGAEAIQKSGDPMIELALRLDPISRKLQNLLKDEYESKITAATEKIAKARFAVYGKSIPPDATFSLRLSYGTVKGYEIGSTYVPYKTTFYGLYDRAASFDNKPPYNLPERVIARKTALDLSTPFNFVCTADIIGGNSGSPVINKNAEIVGLIFDGNIQSLLWNYLYSDEKGRAVAVHSAGIIEALRKIYDADALADELQGRQKE